MASICRQGSSKVLVIPTWLRPQRALFRIVGSGIASGGEAGPTK